METPIKVAIIAVVLIACGAIALAVGGRVTTQVGNDAIGVSQQAAQKAQSVLK